MSQDFFGGNKMTKGKVLVGMSGGVDSSVTAYLLLKEGYEVTGCTLRLYDYTGIGLPEENTCCGINEVNDAKSVCASLGIEHVVINFMESFRKEVIDKFITEYKEGRTPNPCIDCNRTMKFGYMKDWAIEHGYDYIATGHYAEKVEMDGRFYLRKAKDPTRDQSYVLYVADQDTLRMLLLPLGGLIKKTEVRRIAEEQGFVNAKKHDSEDICFVPDGDYAGMMERVTGEKMVPGNIVNTSGKILGKHKGSEGYTIGQRKGLGISAPEPIYVLDKNPKDNTVVVGKNEELFRRDLSVKYINWMREPLKDGDSIRCNVKIRYRHEPEPASVTMMGDTAEIIFDEPQRAITTGQAAVFYDGDMVIGGGTIIK